MARRPNKFSHADELSTAAERKHLSLVDAGKAPSSEAPAEDAAAAPAPTPADQAFSEEAPSTTRETAPAPEKGRGVPEVYIPVSKETRSGRFNGCFRKSDLAKWKKKAAMNDISLARFIERVMNDNCDNDRVVP